MKHPNPILKKNTSFSILLLRDDSGVVKFRLNSFWVKLLMVFFFCFSAASGAAGYAAHYYWKKYHSLQRERTELAAKLGENRRQLGRFAGIEKIKEFSLPRSVMSGVAVASGPEHSPQESAGSVSSRNGHTLPASAEAPQPDSRTTAPQAPAPLPAPPVASGSGQATQGPSEAAATPEQPATSGRPTAGELTTASGPGSSSRGNNVIFTDSNGQTVQSAEGKEHPAAVDDVQIKSSGGSRYKLAFDLSNRDHQFTLNGRVHLHVSTKTDSKIEITQINKDSLRFLINRYKKVNTTFTLPPEIQPDDVTTVHLTVTAEKVPDITFDFPFLPQS